MHQFIATTKTSVIYILIRIGGGHKQQVDQYFASDLGITIHVAGPEHVSSLQELFSDTTVIYQNVVEVRRVVSSISKKASNCILNPFEDWLALDRRKFTFSPVFSVFSKRALKAIRSTSKSDLVSPATLITNSTRVHVLPILDDRTQIMHIPRLDVTITKFKEVVERKYSKSRNSFGSLFDYDDPSSSFLSLYISAGRVSIRQLMEVCSDATFIQELLWNQYCELYIEHYGDQVCSAMYGPYNRSQVKWRSREQGDVIVQALHQKRTGVTLIDAIMNQLIQTGFVPNRLRMVFASWCYQQRLDWRQACRLFEDYLIDYAEASNVFNWQFGYNLTLGRPHIFSLERQLKRFDPKGAYVKRWLPDSR